MLAAFAVIVGLAVVPSQAASAVGCVLGPSLGAAAAKAGISCPTGDGDGSTGGEGAAMWGTGASACKYGWDNSNLPAGFTDEFRHNSLGTSYWELDKQTLTETLYKKDGRIVGRVQVRTYSDHTFMMWVETYGRAGTKHELAFFDCAATAGGPVYIKDIENYFGPMPAPGDSMPSGVTGSVETRGSMSALPGGKYLLRIDVTNNGSEKNFAQIDLGLSGYSVDSIPMLLPGMTCTPFEGLVCSYDGLAPGQKVTTVFVLNSSGDGTAGPVLDMSVTNMGFQKFKASPGSAAVNHPVPVTNFYQIARP